ncbi:MAG: MarR family transcriptional regulator [Acidimicrobiaceae bacterium]|nr:MarR family transcriptional regulator [Acidimicrobiaceae bacterium]
MASWSFLTNHARVLVHIAGDPVARLRDIALTLGITERSVFRIVDDLEKAGYLEKQRNGRRTQYSIQAELPLIDPVASSPSIGEILALLVPVEALRLPIDAD